jgi:hypothetical protein
VVYIGCVESNRLFALPLAPVSSSTVSAAGLESNRIGRVAEHLAIARLLELGHKVAVPVVDDDGVDLVVDYSVKVQVKSSGFVAPDGYLQVALANSRKVRYSADVFLFYNRLVGAFYVFPADAVGAGYKMKLCPKHECWREAWHVFSDLALERAA